MSLTEKKIAAKTSGQLRDTINQTFQKEGLQLGDATITDLIQAIEDGFTVKRKQDVDARPEQPSPEMYQIWRNRNSLRLVQVEAIAGGDVYWECIDGSRGPKKGKAWRWNFYDNYDYIAADRQEYERV